LFVQKFLGIDTGKLSIDELNEKLLEAEYIRNLEVGVITEALSKLFPES